MKHGKISQPAEGRVAAYDRTAVGTELDGFGAAILPRLLAPEECAEIAALYAELPPIYIPELVEDAETLSLLRPEERHLASLVNGQWDIATIVLASAHRELDTLKALSKLNRLGLLRSSAANVAGATRVKEDPPPTGG